MAGRWPVLNQLIISQNWHWPMAGFLSTVQYSSCRKLLHDIHSRYNYWNIVITAQCSVALDEFYHQSHQQANLVHVHSQPIPKEMRSQCQSVQSSPFCWTKIIGSIKVMRRQNASVYKKNLMISLEEWASFQIFG